MLAGVEDIQHGHALGVEDQPVMDLHLSVDPGVVALLEVHPLPLHQGADALRAVAAPDGRIAHPVDLAPLQVRVFRLDLPDLPGHLRGLQPHAGVGYAGAAVVFPDPVHAPLPVHGVPAHAERLGVSPVQAAPDGPGLRHLEGPDHVGEAAVVVVAAVVAPLGEYLPAEGVPVAVEQGVLLGLRHAGQALHVLRVVAQQRRVVKHAAGDKDPALPGLVLRSGLVPPRHVLPDRVHGRGCRDKSLLHPAVAHAAGVGRGPDIDPGARPVGPVSGKQVVVLLEQEVRQLVEADEVVGLALVLHLVLGVLHGPEDNLGPAGEGPRVVPGVVLGLGEHPGVVVQRLVDQLRQLGEGLSQDQPLVVRNLHLPQRLNHQGVALAASGSAAVQGLILRPGHKHRLPGLRLPHHVSSHLPVSPPAAAPRPALSRRRLSSPPGPSGSCTSG